MVPLRTSIHAIFQSDKMFYIVDKGSLDFILSSLKNLSVNSLQRTLERFHVLKGLCGAIDAYEEPLFLRV